MRLVQLLTFLSPCLRFNLQPDGAGGLEGLATLVEFTGATTPPLGHAPILAATMVSWASSTWLQYLLQALTQCACLPACWHTGACSCPARCAAAFSQLAEPVVAAAVCVRLRILRACCVCAGKEQGLLQWWQVAAGQLLHHTGGARSRWE